MICFICFFASFFYLDKVGELKLAESLESCKEYLEKIHDLQVKMIASRVSSESLYNSK